MVKKVLIGLAVVVGMLVLVVGVLAMIAPTDLHVERDVVINQPKEVVFEDLLYLKNQNEWSPWAKRDPNMKQEFRGTDGTVGFVNYWNGNDDVGEGEQEITKITDGERIDYELRFKRPMEDRSDAYILTEAVGEDKTKVTWGMKGKNPFPGNVICYVMDMKGMLARDFDQGLAALKERLEK